MTALTVSLALCTYNGEKFLLEQLQSFLAQTRQPNELVVCDDVSSDRTLEILNEFAQCAPFPVRIFVNDTTLRSTKNFEKAIGLCEGDIIFLSDQDDVWFPDKLARMLTIFEEDASVGAVFSDGEVVGPQLESLGYRLWDTFSFTLSEQKRFRSGKAVEVLLKRNVVTGATMAFRSEFKSVVLPIPQSWVHDGWVALLISAVAKTEFISQPTIKYRQHAANQIGGLRKSLIERVEISIKINHHEYLAVAQQYDEIQIRLSEFVGANSSHELFQKLREKSKHFRARARMPKAFLKRLPLVFRELLSLRYQLYSGGCKSFAKDIFRPFGKQYIK